MMTADTKIMTSANTSSGSVTRSEIEDFLFLEAELLDEWQLDEWLALFQEGATYEVPTAGADEDVKSSSALFYIADDYGRLKFRVERLKSKAAHAEWPRSRLVRLVSNVRIKGESDDGIKVRANFACYRSKHHITDVFVGHINYVLINTADGLRIKSKRVMLDINSLRPHGKVSIIL